MPTASPATTSAPARAPRQRAEGFYQNDAWKKSLVAASLSQIPIVLGDVFAGRALRALAKQQPFGRDVAILAACHSVPSLLQAYSSIHASSWGLQSSHRIIDGITRHMFGQTNNWVEAQPLKSERAHRLANDVPWVLGMLVGFAPKRAEAFGAVAAQAVMMGLLLEPVVALGLVGTVALAYGCSVVSEREDIRELGRSKQLSLPFSDNVNAAKGADCEAQTLEGEEPHFLFGRVRDRFWDNVVLGNAPNFTRWRHDFAQISDLYAGDSIRRERSKANYQAISGLLGTFALGGTLALYAFHLYRHNKQEKLVSVFFPLVARAASIMAQTQTFLSTDQEMQRHERILVRLLGETQDTAKLDLLGKVSPDLQIYDAEQKRHSVAALLSQAPSRGRLTIRDKNKRGKSMFAAAFKQYLDKAAWLLPAKHDLMFEVQAGSSGETATRNLHAMRQDLKDYPHVRTIILDEWDANLDANHFALANENIDELAKDHLVVEITHAATKAAIEEDPS